MEVDSPCLRTVVVDDEQLARDLLKTWVHRHSSLNLVQEFNTASDALKWLQDNPVDLLLLDIQMPGITGVELAEYIVKLPTPPYVIFCTAYQQHAIKAFELSAVDYLVKPIEKSRFIAAVDKAVHHARQQQVFELAQRLVSAARNPPENGDSSVTALPLDHGKAITVKRGDEIIQLHAEDIIWVEAASQYVYVHANQGRFMLSETLSSFSENLPDDGFIRVHRSALINTQSIRKVIQKPNKLYAVVLEGEHTIPLARSRKDLLPMLLGFAKQASHAPRA